MSVQLVEWFPSQSQIDRCARTGMYSANMRYVDWLKDDGVLSFYTLNVSEGGGSVLYGVCRHIGTPGRWADTLAADWLCHGVAPTSKGERGVNPRAADVWDELRERVRFYASWSEVVDLGVRIYRRRAEVRRRAFVVRVES